MRKRDFEDDKQLFVDLWHELTPVLRIGLFTGIGLGALFSICFGVGIFGLPDDTPLPVAWLLTNLALSFPVCGIIGGAVGLTVGVVLDPLFGKKRRPRKDNPRRKVGKTTQRKRSDA